MAGYTASGYYYDPNGRTAPFEVESPSSSRAQIERIVRNRYDAARVQINNVTSNAPPVPDRRERDRLDRQQQEESLERVSYSGSSSYSSSSSSYRQPSYSGGGNIGCGGLIGLLALALLVGIFGGDDETAPVEEPSSTIEAPAPAPAAPSQPAPVYVPSPSARPVYARTEPAVTPVWEMDEDLTGNPDFTFND